MCASYDVHMFADPGSFYASLCALPHFQALLEKFHTDSSFSLVLYGGSIIDVVLHGQVKNDIDLLLQYEGTNLEVADKNFLALTQSFCQSIGAQFQSYPRDHIVIHGVAGLPSIDIHFPSSNIKVGLARSEYTINGIGYNLRTKKFYDPLNGLCHLEKRELVIHSPSYVITGPSAFPRLYRSAAKINAQIPPAVHALVQQYGHMVSITDGRTNIRVLYEFLKILSLSNGFQYLEEMIKDRLVIQMFPEISPLASMNTTAAARHSLTKNLLILKNSFQTIFETDTYLNQRLANVTQISLLGVLRFYTLFIGLGYAYCQLAPDCPYQNEMSGSQNAFTLRMERNILSFMVARFRDYPEAIQILKDLPEVTTAIGEYIEPNFYAAIVDEKQRVLNVDQIRKVEIIKSWLKS